MNGRLFDDGLRRSLGVADLIGVDEAGRGPLAGPVVAAAVKLGAGAARHVCEARDSKALTADKRERLFETIREKAAAVSIAWAQPRRIERENILRATLDSMRRAVLRIPGDGACVLVDGNQRVPGLELPQLTIIDGDVHSLAVSCASIMAKVFRDRCLTRLDRRYPGYGFAQHKGYSTKSHMQALRRLGPCPIHRRTFQPVAELCGLELFDEESVAAIAAGN